MCLVLLLKYRNRYFISSKDGDPIVVPIGLRAANLTRAIGSPTLGDLLTNAKKVTVSVLYWYEKLSSLLTEFLN